MSPTEDRPARPSAVVRPIVSLPLWDKMRAAGRLFSLDLEITARCNNDCRHCYNNLPAGDRDAAAREMSLAEISRLADEAASLGALWVLLTGGEPLLRPDFAEIYAMLRRKGFLVSLFTNATLVNEETVALLRKHPPRDVEVSVYGATAATYEKVTGRPGSFAAFRKGLDLLLAAGQPVRLKAMALRSNVGEMAEIARFCRERTKDYFRFDPQLTLRLDGDPARNDLIREERLGPEEIVALENSDEERMEALVKGCDLLLREHCEEPGCNHLFHCGAGRGSLAVGYDGQLRLCSSLVHPDCVYDLRKGSLTEAWREFVPRVLDLRSDSPDFLEKCRSCGLVNLCLWCPAHAHLETGRMDDAPPHFCRTAEARAEELRKRLAKGPGPV